jgi:hypothetical protein
MAKESIFLFGFGRWCCLHEASYFFSNSLDFLRKASNLFFDSLFHNMIDCSVPADSALRTLQCPLIQISMAPSLRGR